MNKVIKIKYADLFKHLNPTKNNQYSCQYKDIQDKIYLCPITNIESSIRYYKRAKELYILKQIFIVEFSNNEIEQIYQIID